MGRKFNIVYVIWDVREFASSWTRHEADQLINDRFDYANTEYTKGRLPR